MRDRHLQIGRTIILAAVALGLGMVVGATTAKAQNALSNTDHSQQSKSAKSMAELADRHARRILHVSPEFATQMGVDTNWAGEGFASRLSAYDPESNEQTRRLLQQLRAELARFSRAELTGRDQITYDVLDFAYSQAKAQNDLNMGLPSILSANPPYAVNQLFGPQIDIPRLLIAQQPVTTAAQAEDWLARLTAFPGVLEQLLEVTESDATRDIIPPYFALATMANAAEQFVESAPEHHPLTRALRDKLQNVGDMSAAEKRQLTARAIEQLETRVYPTFRKFGDGMRSLIPKAGTGAGVWRLPNGAQAYRVALAAWGAGDLDADEIHEIGLRDVKRIHAAMDSILRDVGYTRGTVGERMSRLAKDPQYLIDDTDEAKIKLVATLQLDIDRVLAIAADWFLDVPSYPVEIRRIPIHEQDAASGGYYTPPPLDGSRPGIFWINLKSAADVPTYTLKSLVFHEAVPGHHFQASKALSIHDLPLIQNMMWFGDYGEGWALYAEELAKEMGLYDGDPLGDLGRYRMELYRAARLVVDTGLHHKRWSRDKAIDYMINVTGEGREAITREIDRYAVWPGQAASYKLGMIQFQRLREKAASKLGDQFDLREFHDVVLRDGSMPMATLARRVDAWIAQKLGAKT